MSALVHTPSASAASACDVLKNPVYTSIHPTTNQQLLTPWLSEADKAASTSGYTASRGTLFKASTTAATGTIPARRLYHPSTGDFVVITDPTEAAAAVSKYGYVDQGVRFHVLSAQSGCGVPVYRFSKSSKHRFVTAAADRSALAASGWTSEGIRFYGAPAAGTVTTTPATPVANNYLPARYASLAQAKTALGAPADANYVMWNHGNKMLDEVFASLGANDILVLPERAQPYLIDSSRGFMAGGVNAVDGLNGTKVPVTSNSRLWFAMARARRGLIGMGPGAVVQPSASAWTQGRQPVPMRAYFTSGSSMTLSGNQNKLIESDKNNGFFGNFTLRGRDFGGVAYGGLVGRQFVRLHIDGGWRGFSGVPNGETGGITILGGPNYRIESVTLTSVNGPSPIMWNRSTGGTTSKVRTTVPNHGMLTFWLAAGVNTFRDVHVAGRSVIMNVEQPAAGFSLDWQGGSASLVDSSAFHINGNPVSGSYKVALRDVAVSGGRNPASLTAHVYSTSNVQKRSDITWANGPVVHYGPMIP